MKPLRVLLMVSLLAGVGAAVRPAGADQVQQVLQLPNLAAVAPYEVAFGDLDDPIEFPEGTTALRFSVKTLNVGAYAMELHGAVKEGQTPEGERSKAASQCVWWASRVCMETVPISEFVYHAYHEHWHLIDYASYELRRVTGAGMPDMSPDGLVMPGAKASFCLMDSYPEMDDPPGRDPLRSVNLYQGCNSYLQGISPGWSDAYGSDLEGQQLPINPQEFADGTYALIVRVNPDNDVLETDPNDDMAWTIIEISEGATKVETISEHEPYPEIEA